ncbi:MAG: hypothetical protein CSA65_09505 [Proteobacteria bacterium]|nr:MAG: hypothetical protein CSA65_09505 [Pseudomonadota bacterium]
MKTLKKTTLAITLGLAMLLGGAAHANGPKTPVDAFHRLQGQRRLRRLTVTGTKLLLQMSATPGAKGKVEKPTKNTRSLLETPKVSQLLRRRKVSFCSGRRCGQSLQDAARRVSGEHTLTTSSNSSKTSKQRKVETPAAHSGFFGRLLDRFSDLLSAL